MKKIPRRSFLQASGVLAAASLAGCRPAGTPSDSASFISSSEAAVDGAIHEPITILTAKRDYAALLELVHQKYPEINVQFEPYRGQNTTTYMQKQLTTGYMPDIYTATYAFSKEAQAAHLVDLSKYSITDLYAPAQMAQVDVDGASYLLPYDYIILSLGYNKSIFERNGWTVPKSFAELQALLPAIRAAGVTPAVCQLDLPGFGFQYFCNISDTIFLNTLEGRCWQQNFLCGDADSSALRESAAFVQQWIDDGLLNLDHPTFQANDCNALFRQGNAAFYLGSLGRYTQNEDGTGDQYGVLPYLSPDGTSNAYILQVNRYYGLNKQLEEPGNEQKLEDALHFLEVLSTPEGYSAVIGENAAILCALRDFIPPETSPYHDALQEINSGHLAPLIYSGWDDYVVNFGNAIRSWVNGKMTGTDALAALDRTQQDVLAAGTPTYANVTETLDTPQAAQLIGQVYISKAGVDAALISYNVWKPGVPASKENPRGVSGKLLPGALTESDIVTILPTGWYGTIPTVTLTGARIQEISTSGYDWNQDDDPYPYVLVTRPGLTLDPTLSYTVAYAGMEDAIVDASDAQDTGIVGLTAAKTYFQQTGSISRKTLW
mgnify:CR=1 FL=1